MYNKAPPENSEGALLHEDAPRMIRSSAIWRHVSEKQQNNQPA
jgi:hypothetical protein